MADEITDGIQEIPIVTDQEQEDFEKSLAADEKALDESLSKKGGQASPKEEVVTEPKSKAGAQETSKTDDEKAKEEAAKKAAESKEPTKWEKAKAREAEAWKKIEAEKAELKVERERIAAERTAPKQQAQVQNKITSKDYEIEADRRELRYQKLLNKKNSEGELSESESKEMTRAQYEAELCRDEAKRLAHQEAIEASSAKQTQQSKEQQNQSWLRAKSEFPEALEKGTPLNLALVDFIDKHQEFIAAVPDGPYAATLFVKAQLEASRVPVLEQEKTTLTEKNAQLQKRVDELVLATSLTGGGSGGLSRPTGERKFEDMTTNEQEKILDQQYAVP